MASIRDIQAVDPRQRLLSSGNLSADLRNLPVGPVLAARVVAGEAGADLVLELAGSRVSLPHQPGLPPGTVLSVRIERGSDGLRLAPMTDDVPVPLPAVLADALRQALPRQISLSALLPLLGRLTGVPLSVLGAADDAGNARSSSALATPPGTAAAATTPATIANERPTPPPLNAPPVAGSSGTHATGATLNTPRESADPVTANVQTRPAPTAPDRDAGLGPARQLPSLESLLSVARARGTSGDGVAPAHLPPSAIAAHVLDPAEPRPATVPGTAISGGGAAAGARFGGESRHDGIADPSARGRELRLATDAEVLPPRVTAALVALAGQAPTITDLRDATRVAGVVAHSGLMLEARLAADPPPSAEEIAVDLKAGLLKVRMAVEEAESTRGPAAPLPATESAAEATRASETGRAVALQALAELVDGTLARIGVNQLQAAGMVEGAPLAFAVEIPLRGDDGRYQPLEFEFEREAEDPSGQRHASTSVTLRMQPPGLGAMAAVLRLGAEHLVTELWAEDPATRALLYDTREQLEARLRAAGLAVTTVRLAAEPPPRPPMLMHHTQPLVEAEV